MEEKLKTIVKKYLNKDHILVDVTENFESGFIRVTVDSANSVTLNDTALLSRALIKSEEFSDRYPNGCRIEITTPGVDTPLKEPYQFQKNIKKDIKIRFRKEDCVETINCRLLSVNDKSIHVKHLNENFFIRYNQIEYAKVLLSFK